MPFILKLKKGGLLLCDEIDPEKLMVILQKKARSGCNAPDHIRVTNLIVVNKY